MRFLDQCASLILLKKVGGGYIFIHRTLLEYFAELELSAENVQSRAAEALGQMGEAGAKSPPEVAALLKDPESDVRWAAATVLGQMGEAGAKFTPEVAALLTDPDSDVRRSAATALKQFQGPKSAAPEMRFSADRRGWTI